MIHVFFFCLGVEHFTFCLRYTCVFLFWQLGLSQQVCQDSFLKKDPFGYGHFTFGKGEVCPASQRLLKLEFGENGENHIL